MHSDYVRDYTICQSFLSCGTHILSLLTIYVGLKDPWGAPSNTTELLPSYDSLVKPDLTDPWSMGGAPVTNGVNLDPWGGGGGVMTSAPPTQPLPTIE